MLRPFFIIAIFVILFTLSACSRPPKYEILLQNNTVLLYKNLNSDEAREQVKSNAENYCSYLGKKTVYGKSSCNSESCETSYLCE